ncbi:MAG: sugar 3,4-ketoisomerase [Solirubrobacteraceae bacterium]
MNGCRIISLSVFSDPRGNLTVIEGSSDVPFDIARVYYVRDVPVGAARAGHAHRRLEQLLIAANGAFDAVLDDGCQRQTVRLSQPSYGLYLPVMVWRELTNFTAGAVCLSLASMPYDSADYFYDYDEYVRIVKSA